MTRQGDDTAGENGVRDIETAVLAYLHRRPRAADTLRGIVNWWLPLQRYESGAQRIELALTELVTSGLLRCDRLPDGEVLYALRRQGQRHRPH